MKHAVKVKFIKRNKDWIYSLLSLILFVAFLFLVLTKEKNISFSFSGEQKEDSLATENQNVSPISGLPCDNYNQRPIAIMLANDTIARPLSGLGEADLVVEMPVVQNGITRLMAIFVCNAPEEIGSVRSSRHDFIPLAMGFDAIYGHWGGSHFALDKLNARIMDNIDALTNPFDAYYRKSGIYAPHNGFTSIEKLINSANKLGYRLENKFVGYPHYDNKQLAGNNKQNGILKISYPVHYAVEYNYNAEKNSYFRQRNGKSEIDKNNNSQVEAKNVVVMYSKSRELEGQYNDVDVEGEGKAIVFQNGEAIDGIWKKDKANSKSKLYFFNLNGEEMKFVSGQIWIEIIEPGKDVIWQLTAGN